MGKAIKEYDFRQFDFINKNYRIYDSKDGYYELIGILDSGYLIVIRTSEQNVNESITFAARLFSSVSAVLLMLEVVFVLIVTNSFSKPIIEMSRVAKQMSKLNFNAKVEVKSNDEIGDLGRSMNELSSKLHYSISELKEANLQLSRDIKKKEELEEMRSEFLSHVSHELKTPLTSISGYAELIETGLAQGEDCKKFAGNIRTETARLQTLIGDILRLSELDTIASASLDDVVDIAAVAKECKERLTGQAEKKDVRISIHGTSKPIKGNHTELTELIYNLIDNAIKYNRENGNIDITIEDNRFIIADTGIGMPKESIPRIFERFYRVDKSRSRAKGGTGLGLSIVKHIADRHGAQIDVESTMGVGTTISVYFR